MPSKEVTLPPIPFFVLDFGSKIIKLCRALVITGLVQGCGHKDGIPGPAVAVAAAGLVLGIKFRRSDGCPRLSAGHQLHGQEGPVIGRVCRNPLQGPGACLEPIQPVLPGVFQPLTSSPGCRDGQKGPDLFLPVPGSQVYCKGFRFPGLTSPRSQARLPAPWRMESLFPQSVPSVASRYGSVAVSRRPHWYPARG